MDATPMSACQAAIEQTARTIERRERRLLNQVLIGILVSCVIVLSAVVSRTPPVLWALLLLVPAGGLYLCSDDRALNEWRSRVVAAWAAGALDFGPFRESIRSHPQLASPTAERMLSGLPAVGGLAAEKTLSTSTRHAIAAATAAEHQSWTERLRMRVLASAVVVGSVLAAVWMHHWIPLVALETLAFLPIVSRWRRRRRDARREAELAVCRRGKDFSEEDYLRVRSNGLD